MITEGQWKHWKDNSTTDDRLNAYVLSDIRQMLGEIERQQAAIRDAHFALTKSSLTPDERVQDAVSVLSRLLAQDERR